VLVTGATGFIGPKLVRLLLTRGDRVIALVRNTDKARAVLGPASDVVTDLAKLPDTAPIDAIVNLAGESIAGGLWTARRRSLLLESRLGVTRALLTLVARLTIKPRTWVNASAIGYYGARAGDAAVDERTPCGSGFQADLCRRWEETAAEAGRHGVDVAVLRFGIVLGRDGGALPALARPVRLFAGTVLGDGRQWTSWIHIDDALALLLFVLDRETLRGPINATSPLPVRHAELMSELATTLHRFLWPLRVPAPLLRAGLGELAELFVDGQRVMPERAIALGYHFNYGDIGSALRNLLGTAP
jgi:uncharacterized protein (TIGR01777 family)